MIYARNPSASSQMFRTAMTTAVTQARDFSQGALANSPIFLRSLVKLTSGKTANGSCILRITWLRTNSLAVPAGSPERRDDNRWNDRHHPRDQPAQPWPRRMFRKPSITTWPARVPVRVEFCPEASSASANMVLAPVTPSSGVNSL